MNELESCPFCGWTPPKKQGISKKRQLLNHLGYHSLQGEDVPEEVWAKVREE